MDKLFLLPSAARRDPGIDAWFAAPDHELRRIAQPWFERMRGCGSDVRELLHDGHPTACVGEAPFAYVDAFGAHANVGFFYGFALADPARLLEGAGKRMRHVKLRYGARGSRLRTQCEDEFGRANSRRLASGAPARARLAPATLTRRPQDVQLGRTDRNPVSKDKMTDLYEVLQAEVAAIDPVKLRAASKAVAAAYTKESIARVHGRDFAATASELLIYGRRELHKLLCRDTKDYKDERAALLSLKTSFLVLVASAISSKFGVAEGMAAAFGTVIVSLPIKVGVNAWCAHFRDNIVSRVEQIALRDD